LPVFSEPLVEEVLPSWPWGPPIKEKKRMCGLLKAIMFLKTHGLHGAGVIRGYHARRVTSLMARTRPLFGMMPIVELGGTVLAQGPLHNSKILHHIKEATDESDAMFLIPRHPMMRLELGFYCRWIWAFGPLSCRCRSMWP